MRFLFIQVPLLLHTLELLHQPINWIRVSDFASSQACIYDIYVGYGDVTTVGKKEKKIRKPDRSRIRCTVQHGSSDPAHTVVGREGKNCVIYTFVGWRRLVYQLCVSFSILFYKSAVLEVPLNIFFSANLSSIFKFCKSLNDDLLNQGVNIDYNL